MFRNKPQSFEETPNHSLTFKAVYKHLPLKEIQSWKRMALKRIKQWRTKTPELNLNDLQRSTLADIGDRLRQARLRQKLSLETITLETQIPVRLLEAIEAGDLEALPESIYVRGMIRQFADRLGLEGSAIARELPTESAAVSAVAPKRTPIGFLQIRPIHLYLFYIALVMLSVQGLSNFLRQSASDTSLLDVPPPPAPPLSTAIAPPRPSPATPVTNPTKIPHDKVVVELQLKDDSWLKVIVDGKPQFEGILAKGTHRQWQAEQEVKVRAGNAGGVEVIVNQQEPQPLGKPGQVEEATYKRPTQS